MMTKVLLRVGVAILAVAAIIGAGTWWASQRSDDKASPQEPEVSVSSGPAGSSAAEPSAPPTEPAESKEPAQSEEAEATASSTNQTESAPIPKLPALTFDVSSATLNAEADAKIKALAKDLDEHRDWRVVITGHADNIGDGHSNLILSRQRAESTAVRLRELGVNSSRVRSDWKSSDEPVATNDTKEGRAKNRRVEIVLSEATQS
ncbi:MAG: OmpA family protein [Galactobacter sp.]